LHGNIFRSTMKEKCIGGVTMYENEFERAAYYELLDDLKKELQIYGQILTYCYGFAFSLL